MTDDIPTPPSPVPVSVFAALRRMTVTLALLAALWLAYVYAVPRFLLPRAAPAPVEKESPMQGDPADEPAPKPSPAVTAPAAGLARIETLEARLKAFEDVLTALPKDDPGNRAIHEKIGALETRIDALQQQNRTETIDGERLARLEARLDELQSALESLKEQWTQAQNRFDRQITAHTAFRQLKETVGRGEPFSTALAYMRLVAERQPQASGLLDQLSAQADGGIPTLALLQEQFKSAIPQALAPNADSLGGKLQSLILVRKVGEQQPGNDVQAIVARAEARLAHGDVEGCVSELARLPKPSARRMAPWIEQARTVLAVRQQLDALELALDSAAPSASPPAESAPDKPAAQAPAPEPEPANPSATQEP